MKARAMIVAAMLGWALLPTAWGGSPPAGESAGPTTRPSAAAPADGNASDTTSGDLEELLRGLSPEDVAQLVQSAVESRLKVERQQAIEEIKEGLLYEPEDVEAAVKMIQDKPANTQRDNIDRILRAFAQVDLHFGRAYKLLEKGEAAKAVEAVTRDLNVQEASYLSAARYTLYARALAADSKRYEAVEAYQQILVAMADRISFAAAAAVESARIYEEMQRFTYASQMYQFAVTNYGLTLDKADLDRIAAKMDEHADFAKDPLGWAGGQMGEVRKRLDSVDSGKETQKKEERIVAVITDLIKTAEEQQRSGQGQGQSQSQAKDKRKGEGEGQGQSQGQASGSSQSGPKGTQQPSSPAQASALVPGAVARMTKQSQVHDTPETGDWANLPPRERQALEQIRRKIMSERYRQIISDYRTKIAEQKSPASP